MTWDHQERRNLATRVEILEFIPATGLDGSGPPDWDPAAVLPGDAPQLDPAYWFI